MRGKNHSFFRSNTCQLVSLGSSSEVEIGLKCEQGLVHVALKIENIQNLKTAKENQCLQYYVVPKKKIRILYIVVDSNALYIFFVPDWDSECWPNLDPDPSVMLAIQKKCVNSFREKHFFKKIRLKNIKKIMATEEIFSQLVSKWIILSSILHLLPLLYSIFTTVVPDLQSC